MNTYIENKLITVSLCNLTDSGWILRETGWRWVGVPNMVLEMLTHICGSLTSEREERSLRLKHILFTNCYLLCYSKPRDRNVMFLNNFLMKKV